MSRNGPSDREVFFSMRKRYRNNNDIRDTTLWNDVKTKWAKLFPSCNPEKLRDWIKTIKNRETKARVFEDSVIFAAEFKVENILYKAPNLESCKNMQMYFCEAIESALENLTNITKPHVQSGTPLAQRENYSNNGTD
jgi:hypothetical protein